MSGEGAEMRRRNPHPAALAFTRSLDQHLSWPNNGSGSDTASTGRAAPRVSSTIQKLTHTLGWRSCHSHDEWYPVTVGSETIRVRQVQQNYAGDDSLGTGATVWPAAVVLIKYLEKCPQILRHKTVADLGSGTGVTSIAAAHLGASLVVCTDGCDPVVDLAKSNVAHAKELANSGDEKSMKDCEIRVRNYQWNDGTMNAESSSKNNGVFDVILVADCVLPKLYPIEPLVCAIDELSGPSTETYLSYEHRYFPEYDPRDKFRELAEQRGFDVSIIPLSEQDPIYSVDDIEIWKVKRCQSIDTQ
mmetsp:Transcript_9378/g.16987  ORF Transcript_9378/g.16987 Transcript_9378/m.16987 type:complete len:302 (-) Transcript_9378:128-1033(-)